MPLYEYQCQQCHRRVEKIQKFSDAALTVCPHCGGALERTVTAPAIQFKGSGWYKDLYSSAKPPAAGGAATSGEGTPAAAGSSEAAPSAAGDAKSAAPAKPAPSSTPAAASSPSGTGGS